MSVTVSHNQLEELVQSFNGREGASLGSSILINPATLYQFAQLRIRQIFCAKFLLGCLVFSRRTVFFSIYALFLFKFLKISNIFHREW